MAGVGLMNSQGLIGALNQYWNVEPKVRLHRKNTYFEDHKVSNVDALRFGLVFIVVSLIIMSSWCIIGAIL